MRYSKFASPKFTYYFIHLNVKRKARHTQNTPNENNPDTNPKLKSKSKILS